uniref:Uncharacterized protein n=1 Tax=Arundo donax TaxID=35708 RepID=A0A0A9FNP1_ARUDO
MFKSSGVLFVSCKLRTTPIQFPSVQKPLLPSKQRNLVLNFISLPPSCARFFAFRQFYL